MHHQARQEEKLTCGRCLCSMYVLISCILTMYSLEAAFIEISSVVTMLARKVQMHVPANKLSMVIQQSPAHVGSCLPYPEPQKQ